MLKAEHEIREAYLMQHMVDLQHNMEDRPLHQHSDLVSYPEKWDWREKGFVTDVSMMSSYRELCIVAMS